MRYLNYTKSDLDKKGPNSYYDWRLGIPAMLQSISDRLLVIADLDPNFAIDGSYNSELKTYRDKLIEHYNRMLNGVRCDVPIPAGSRFSYIWYPCADIHTGLSTRAFRSKETCNSYYVYGLFWTDPLLDTETLCGAVSEDDQEVFADLRREVIRRMPLYEMKSVIDTLFLYMHPMGDLTERLQRIPSFATPSLCLTANGDTNGARLQLFPCGILLQHWVYDRQSGVISNPDIGKCLEISYQVHASGQNFPVSISDCFGDDWQKWTYDPETYVLLSAMGPVLTIKEGWPADIPGSLVSNSVLAGPPPQNTASAQQKWWADPLWTTCNPAAAAVVCRFIR
jgi:hypothetical protein